MQDLPSQAVRRPLAVRDPIQNTHNGERNHTRTESMNDRNDFCDAPLPQDFLDLKRQMKEIQQQLQQLLSYRMISPTAPRSVWGSHPMHQ